MLPLLFIVLALDVALLPDSRTAYVTLSGCDKNTLAVCQKTLWLGKKRAKSFSHPEWRLIPSDGKMLFHCFSWGTLWGIESPAPEWLYAYILDGSSRLNRAASENNVMSTLLQVLLLCFFVEENVPCCPFVCTVQDLSESTLPRSYVSDFCKQSNQSFKHCCISLNQSFLPQ